MLSSIFHMDIYAVLIVAEDVKEGEHNCIYHYLNKFPFRTSNSDATLVLYCIILSALHHMFNKNKYFEITPLLNFNPCYNRFLQRNYLSVFQIRIQKYVSVCFQKYVQLHMLFCIAKTIVHLQTVLQKYYRRPRRTVTHEIQRLLLMMQQCNKSSLQTYSEKQFCCSANKVLIMHALGAKCGRIL